MEPILDETSLEPCSTRTPAARIHALALTLKALDRLGATRVLRSVREAPYRDLEGGRGLAAWCFDRATPKEAGLLVAARLDKAPYVDGDGGLFAKAEGGGIAEARFECRPVLGLGLAALTDGVAVALTSEARPFGGKFTVDLDYSDADGERKDSVDVLVLATEPEVIAARGDLLARIGTKTPSEAFRAVVEGSPDLVLHDDALKSADELPKHRWRFANTAATLLARYAAQEQLGALREWKQSFGVEFAANGPVTFKYEWTHNGQFREGHTEWHLKEGDKTTRESAARIYFARVEFDEVKSQKNVRIVVLYVGPHPKGGQRTLALNT